MLFWSSYFLLMFLSKTDAQPQIIIEGNFGMPKGTFDPSSFTTEIAGCHIQCGNEYYDCAAFWCAMMEQSSNDRIEGSIKKSVELKPTFWSKFLYYFTFGLVGSIKSSRRVLDMEMIKPTLQINENQPTTIDKQYSCEHNCTNRFRNCYSDCVCDVRPLDEPCRKIIVVPQTLVPPLRSKYDGDGAYVFDWHKVL
ncbi:hypothetical protein ACF0H5_011785 [Mactra antiquata]